MIEWQSAKHYKSGLWSKFTIKSDFMRYFSSHISHGKQFICTNSQGRNQSGEVEGRNRVLQSVDRNWRCELCTEKARYSYRARYAYSLTSLCKIIRALCTCSVLRIGWARYPYSLRAKKKFPCVQFHAQMPQIGLQVGSPPLLSDFWTGLWCF